MSTEFSTFSSPCQTTKFECVNCNFKCSKLSDWNRHIITSKHLKGQDFNNFQQEKALSFKCENCNKIYKERTGLFKHKKKCIKDNISEKSESEIKNETQNELNILTNKDELIIKLIKDNEEFKQLLKEQNLIISQQQQQISELIPKIGNTTIHNTNNTNNNNTTNNNSFNLNFFLNETCKNAINMSDFIASIQFTDDDLKNSRIHGGVSTISNKMIKGLQQLDITKRPLHCTDMKRETLYIKEQEKWEKDENHAKIIDAFTDIAQKQRDYLWEWSDANPDSQDVMHPLNDVFHHTNVKVLDPINYYEKESKKFIRNISKEILIDKK